MFFKQLPVHIGVNELHLGLLGIIVPTMHGIVHIILGNLLHSPNFVQYTDLNWKTFT